MKTLRISLSLALALFLTLTVFSQNKVVWRGGTPGMVDAWNCPKNWSNHRIPDAFSDVIIPDVSGTSLAFPIIRKDSCEINSLFLYSNATLTIEQGAQLSIYSPDQSQYDVSRILGKGRLNTTNETASKMPLQGVAVHKIIH